MIDIQKWSKKVLRSENQLEIQPRLLCHNSNNVTAHPALFSTYSTSRAILHCLSSTARLLLCYSATQTPLQTISRFQTHAVGLFASPRFQNRCISVHLFSCHRPSWQWPALSRIACKSWTMLRKCVGKKSNAFLWNSLPIAVSTFHLYFVVTTFFQR